MGFQWTMEALAGDSFQLDGGFDAENISLPLILSNEASTVRWPWVMDGRI
jgi:hypothetical protein